MTAVTVGDLDYVTPLPLPLSDYKIYSSSFFRFSISRLSAIIRLSKIKTLTLRKVLGVLCITIQKFIKMVEFLHIYCNLTVFKMAPVRHHEFMKLNFLTVGAVKKPILHHRAKFRKDQSNRCGDIAILVIFKMAAAVILDFQKFEILTVGSCKGPMCVSVPNFIKIGQAVATIWRFNKVFKMVVVRHLGFVGRVLGPSTMSTWWSLL